jgi:hypothetical protein
LTIAILLQNLKEVRIATYKEELDRPHTEATRCKVISLPELGRGVAAARDIEESEFICEYRGKLYSDKSKFDVSYTLPQHHTLGCTST